MQQKNPIKNISTIYNIIKLLALNLQSSHEPERRTGEAINQKNQSC